MNPSIDINQILVAIGAVIASVVAGLFSHLALVVSKEQKISEFRKVWIDSLRNEISEYLAAANFYIQAYDKKNAHDTSTIKQLEESFLKTSKSYTMIVLRINQDEKDKKIKEQTKHLLLLLNDMQRYIKNLDNDSASDNIPRIRQAAQPILKHEWERVKKGEPVYRYSKMLALFFIASGVIIALKYIFW